MQPNQMVPLTATVATKAPIATGGRVAASLGPPGSNFVTDSWRICRNETIIMMEKTRIPSGSSLRRPTGNLRWSRPIFHWTSLLVVHIISVHRRSRAESTREAISEREDDVKAAMTLAISSRMFAITLIWTMLVLMAQDGLKASESGGTDIDGPLCPLFTRPPLLSLVFWK